MTHWGSVFALAGMPPTAADARIIPLSKENSKQLERMGWQNMSPQEFSDTHLGILKGLARVLVSIPKSQLRYCIKESNLTLEVQERELLVEKIRSAMSWCKDKLRNAGSGKFLPGPCKALSRALKPAKRKAPPKDKDEQQVVDIKEKPTPAQIRQSFGLADKKNTTTLDISSTSSESDYDFSCAEAQQTSNSSALAAASSSSRSATGSFSDRG